MKNDQEIRVLVELLTNLNDNISQFEANVKSQCLIGKIIN